MSIADDRAKIIEVAGREKGIVFANERDPADTQRRLGYQRLVVYFQETGNQASQIHHAEFYTGPVGQSIQVPDPKDPTKTKTQLIGLAHWCGIFALWALKKGSGRTLGHWVSNAGMRAATGISELPRGVLPQPGDVGVLLGTNVHHVIAYETSPLGSRDYTAKTIEGNWGKRSEVYEVMFPHHSSEFDTWFTAFPLFVEETLIGEWKVKCGNSDWRYVFSPGGTVTWKDGSSSGSGLWQSQLSRRPPDLELRWPSGGVENWQLPLNALRTNGTCRGKTYPAPQLSAVKK